MRWPWLCLLLIPHTQATDLARRQLTLPLSRGQAVVTAGPPVPLSALAFRPGTQILAAGGYQEIVLWDIQSGQLTRRIGTGQIAGQVRALAFHKDGRWLAIAEGTPAVSGAVRLLDFNTGEVAATLGESKDEILALAFSADGKLLAAGGADRLVHVWSVEDRKPVAELKAHNDWISALAFSPDGKLLASGSADRSVQVWDTAAWKPLISLPQTVSEPISGVAFSPDGANLLFSVNGPDERMIRTWRPEMLQPGRPNPKYTRPFDTGTCLPLGVLWPAGARPRLLVPCTDGTVRMLAPTGGTFAVMSGHQDWVYAVAANREGTRLASAGGDGTVRLWNGTDGAPLATLIQLRPRTDEWLIVTASGNFTGSNPAAIELKAADGKPLADDLRSRLQDAQTVRDILSAKPPAKKK